MARHSRIIQLSDIEEILEFEEQQIAAKIPDEAERIFAQWNSRTRKEALEHHFNLGWSFLVRDKSKASKHSEEGLLLGYFMAQPILFFEGQTQSLWVEHISTVDPSVTQELCELAYRLSREKHFQRVYLPNDPEVVDSVQFFNPQPFTPSQLMIKTTKVN